MLVGSAQCGGYAGEHLADELGGRGPDLGGEFDPLDERGLLEEVLLFVENLECDCSFITHHTIGGANLTGPNFLGRKDAIVAALSDEIEHGDMERMARRRAMKVSL